jgi:hypothetical protein
VALVGTDLAPLREGAGALESLLCGWAGALAGLGHDIHLVSVGHDAACGVPTGVTSHLVCAPSNLPLLIRRIAPDAVVLNNRPAWGERVAAPVLHLFHNWPDAWASGDGPVDLGTAGAAAMSRSLADVVAAVTRRPAGSVRVVVPFVAPPFLHVERAREPGLVLAPNRLLAKKGVRELAAAAGRPGLVGRRVCFTDYLSPWTEPTAEHREMRAVVRGTPGCELIAAPRGPAAMARLYASADVVVVPSIHPEGLGMTAVEAQHCGVPVVSSGLGGLGEATLRGELVVDPSQPDALAATIGQAAALGPDERDALARDASERWSPATSLRSLLDALDAARPPGGLSGAQ